VLNAHISAVQVDKVRTNDSDCANRYETLEKVSGPSCQSVYARFIICKSFHEKYMCKPNRTTQFAFCPAMHFACCYIIPSHAHLAMSSPIFVRFPCNTVECILVSQCPSRILKCILTVDARALPYTNQRQGITTKVTEW
jgi:hypothetical protein